ncbi:MAG TPA: hypothetical protein VK814_17120 [Acidobacteriaceae bacterium]|jgi:hypothetical protein|nr:hypothetical protein [Acidobacteriaceae bacterium]
MDHPHQQLLDPSFGKLSPFAPPELAAFAFLIGSWQCNARIKASSGEWHRFDAEWLGRFILDGHAIADEYRMTTLSGDLVVLGMNLRTYDPATHTWRIQWLNALTGAWTDLVSQDLGGVHINRANGTGSSITYAFKEPTASHPYTRATYTAHSPAHFTWKGDQSADSQTWTDFMLVECYRNH